MGGCVLGPTGDRRIESKLSQPTPEQECVCAQCDPCHYSVKMNKPGTKEVHPSGLTSPLRESDEWREPVEVAEYQAVLSILGRFDVSHGIANQVFELKQGALSQMEEVLANTNLASGEKQVWLQVLRQQVGETLAGTLGPECFREYRRTCGSWIDQLGFAEKSRNRESENANAPNVDDLSHLKNWN